LSFGSCASRGGTAPSSAPIAAVASSAPQPVNGSRPSAQDLHPEDAVASTAVRSMIAVTCSGRSSGRAPRRFAATAVACGAENDVPSGGRKSSVAQGVYPWSTHAARAAVSERGNVERMSSPGAATSL